MSYNWCVLDDPKKEDSLIVYINTPNEEVTFTMPREKIHRLGQSLITAAECTIKAICLPEAASR